MRNTESFVSGREMVLAARTEKTNTLLVLNPNSSEKLKVHSFFQDEHSQKYRLAAVQNSVLSIKTVGKQSVRLYFTGAHINSLSFKLFKENAFFEGQQLPY